MSGTKAYSNTVCLGNWFEDRIQSDKKKTTKNTRIIADYGYRIFDTDASRTWGMGLNEGKGNSNSKKSRAEALLAVSLAKKKGGGGFDMAQGFTYQDSIKDRKSSIPEEGFGALLPKEKIHEVMDMKSTNQYSYGDSVRQSSTVLKKLKSADAPFCGNKAVKKIKGNQPLGLSGEVWKDGSDPQNSTLAQRAWMYGEDPAIHYKLNGYPVLLQKDIEQTGLEIGTNKSYNPNGNFKRVATLTKCNDVMGSNSRQGENVWMDMRGNGNA